MPLLPNKSPKTSIQPIVKNYPIPIYVRKEIAMCLWDADRLDLDRVGFDIDKNYLNTDYAKSLIR